MKTIIHVDRSIISLNTRDGGNRPVYIVRQDRKVTYARKVIIKGPSETVFDNSRNNTIGTTAYLITESDVELIDPMSYHQACLAK